MDNELDFRVGDVVCDIRYGTGEVIGIDCAPKVPVRFNTIDKVVYYHNNGSCDCYQMFRSLYHGTWEQVFGNLPDLKPKRKVKRWVNLYPALGHDGLESRISYTSAAHASSHADHDAVAVAVEVDVDE